MICFKNYNFYKFKVIQKDKINFNLSEEKMKKIGSTNEEVFLAFLLKEFGKDDKTYLTGIINAEIVQQALVLLLSHFENEDKQNVTNNVDIIKKIFINETVTVNNCSFEVGICKKTFYRYKEKYLQVFKNYLLQCLYAE